MTPRTSTLSVDRICSRLSSGITSMMRSIAFEAEFACSVPITRTPVSAAWMARPMVSRSRISPTMSTSGDSRRALRSAAANDSACLPTWRWVMTASWLVCRYSIGSSMLITCFCEVLLISSTIAARVVDLPDPVGPVTRTRPLLSSVSRFTAAGIPRSSRVGISFLITRNTEPKPWLWTNTLARNRATPGSS